MTTGELADTGEFQGLFQWTFETEFHHRHGTRHDLLFEHPAVFSFDVVSNTSVEGRFSGLVNTLDGRKGTTDGTFRVHLPAGLTAGEPAHILDCANMEVPIDAFPW